MTGGYLEAVERWTLVLGALVLLPSLMFLSARGQLGATLGVALMVLNAHLLRRVAGRLRRLLSEEKPSVGMVLFLFNAKLLGLVGLIYLCVRYLPIDPLPFILGISILPLAILLTAVAGGLPSSLGGPDATAKPPASGGEG